MGVVPIVGVAFNSDTLSAVRQAAPSAIWPEWRAISRAHQRACLCGGDGIVRNLHVAGSETAEPFAKNLLRDLDEIDATAKSWSGDVVESDVRSSKPCSATSISHRVPKELVRKAQFEETASARAFGDNDANRKACLKRTDELVELGKAYADDTTRSTLEVRASTN